MFRIRFSLAAFAAAALWWSGANVVGAGSVDSPLIEPEVIRPASKKVDWSGFYAGGNLAYAWGESDRVGHRAPDGTLVSNVGEFRPGGFNYGLRLGWRNTIPVARSSYVYAFELGYDAGDIGDSTSTATQQASTSLNDVFSLRFKSGATNFAGDTWFYGILGYSRGDISYSVSGTAGGDTISVSDRSDYDGYVLGLGVERAFSHNVSLTLEYEFTSFNSKVLTDSGGSTTDATPRFGNLRLGLNYAF